MADTVSQGLMLASQMKQMLLDFLARLKFSSSAVTRKTMRMLNHAACQVKASNPTPLLLGEHLRSQNRAQAKQ